MATGPGKYDDLATLVRKRSDAEAVIVIVLGGKRGHGFAVQVRPADLVLDIPALLRRMANDIEADLQSHEA